MYVCFFRTISFRQGGWLVFSNLRHTEQKVVPDIIEYFGSEATDKWATAAPLKHVKTAVKFYGICRAIKLLVAHPSFSTRTSSPSLVSLVWFLISVSKDIFQALSFGVEIILVFSFNFIQVLYKIIRLRYGIVCFKMIWCMLRMTRIPRLLGGSQQYLRLRNGIK